MAVFISAFPALSVFQIASFFVILANLFVSLVPGIRKAHPPKTGLYTTLKYRLPNVHFYAAFPERNSPLSPQGGRPKIVPHRRFILL